MRLTNKLKRLLKKSSKSRGDRPGGLFYNGESKLCGLVGQASRPVLAFFNTLFSLFV